MEIVSENTGLIAPSLSNQETKKILYMKSTRLSQNCCSCDASFDFYDEDNGSEEHKIYRMFEKGTDGKAFPIMMDIYKGEELVGKIERVKDYSCCESTSHHRVSMFTEAGLVPICDVIIQLATRCHAFQLEASPYFKNGTYKSACCNCSTGCNCSTLLYLLISIISGSISFLYYTKLWYIALILHSASAATLIAYIIYQIVNGGCCSSGRQLILELNNIDNNRPSARIFRWEAFCTSANMPFQIEWDEEMDSPKILSLSAILMCIVGVIAYTQKQAFISFTMHLLGFWVRQKSFSITRSKLKKIF